MGCGGSRTEDKTKPGAKQRLVYVLGGPGSGKGSQCEKLVKEFGFIHMSAGDLLREEVKNKGPNAETIEKIQKEGALVSSELLVEIIKATLAKHPKNGRFLLDGFPRSQQNLDAWEKIIKDTVDVSFLLHLTCSEETMEKRLIKRGETSNRSDDNPETIRKRFQTFRNETMPVVKKMGEKVVEVSSEDTIEQVFGKVKEAVIAKGLNK